MLDAPVVPQPESTAPITPAEMPASQTQPATRTNELATAALILGILGFIWILPIIGPILAIIFGAIALSQIKQGKGTGKGMAYAGLWLGITSLALSLLVGILIFATVPALQRNARNTEDSKRRAELNSVVMILEQYHAEKGFYPAQLGDIAPSILDQVYIYEPSPIGCVGTSEEIVASPNAPVCTNYRVKVILNDGSEYVRQNVPTKTKTIPIPSVNKTQ